MSRLPLLLLLCAAGLGLGGCAGAGGSSPATRPIAVSGSREVAVGVVRPPPVNLFDRGVATLAVDEFAGPGGADLAQDLAAQISAGGAFQVLAPGATAERLMRVGVRIGWEPPESALIRFHDRADVDAVVVGRVEIFDLEDREKQNRTVTLQRTGEFGFVVNEEGKIAYREKLEYASVPLYCRSDHGTVAASYRVWDAPNAALIASIRHELSGEVESFCYRGDVPERLKQAAQDRLLRKLFRQLNGRFIRDILPRTEQARAVFETLPAGADPILVHRNELGILYAEKGDWQRAQQMWEDCLKDAPRLSTALYNLAVVDSVTARPTSALARLEKAIAIDPRPLYLKAHKDVRAGLAGER